MMWGGMTDDQRRVYHIHNWTPKFALFPVQLTNGNWLWLEWYAWRWRGLPNARVEVLRKLLWEDDPCPPITRPAPPPGLNGGTK